MSYNNDLQNNNTELRSILAMAESLPEAGANWSTYSAKIRAIEDYPEITGG